MVDAKAARSGAENDLKQKKTELKRRLQEVKELQAAKAEAESTAASKLKVHSCSPAFSPIFFLVQCYMSPASHHKIALLVHRRSVGIGVLSRACRLRFCNVLHLLLVLCPPIVQACWFCYAFCQKILSSNTHNMCIICLRSGG